MLSGVSLKNPTPPLTKTPKFVAFPRDGEIGMGNAGGKVDTGGPVGGLAGGLTGGVAGGLVG